MLRKDKKIKLYDVVLNLMRSEIIYRNSDKALMWAVWIEQGLISPSGQFLYKHEFLQYASTPESVTRARRKIQRLHPELQSTEAVLEQRKSRASSRGLFIFHEELL